MRRERDFYPTPPWVTDFLLDRITPEGFILEPCAGEGAIARRVRLRDFKGVVVETDIHPNPNIIHVCDFAEAIAAVKPDWVITNPPFSDQWRFLECALSVPHGAVLFRVTALCPGKRSLPVLEELGPRVNRLIFVGPAPSFSGDGKADFCSVVWVVWGPKPSPVLIDFVWANPSERKVSGLASPIAPVN